MKNPIQHNRSLRKKTQKPSSRFSKPKVSNPTQHNNVLRKQTSKVKKQVVKNPTQQNRFLKKSLENYYGKEMADLKNQLANKKEPFNTWKPVRVERISNNLTKETYRVKRTEINKIPLGNNFVTMKEGGKIPGSIVPDPDKLLLPPEPIDIT